MGWGGAVIKPWTAALQSARYATFKGTVSPDFKWLEMISIKSPWLGYVTPDIKQTLNSPLDLQWVFEVLKHTTTNIFQFSFFLELEYCLH